MSGHPGQAAGPSARMPKWTAGLMTSVAAKNVCRMVEEREVSDANHYDRPAVIAGLLHELPRPVQVVIHHRLGSNLRHVGSAAGEDRITGPVIPRLSDAQVKIGHLVHHVEQRLTRLPIIERRNIGLASAKPPLPFRWDRTGRSAEPGPVRSSE
jgi:hypothetical protein